MTEEKTRTESNASEKRTKMNRRTFFRWGVGLLGGLAVARAVRGFRREQAPPPLPKVTILPACVACTGCVSICPTNAIVVAPDSIKVIDDLCVRCGYCVAVCPVGGLRINREADHA